MCLTLFDPMDCSPPGSSVHGISQVRILQCVPTSFFRGSYQCRNQICLSRIFRQILYHWATKKTLKTVVVVVQLLVMSGSLGLHGLQHARLFSPTLTPRVCSNSCPLSQWYYLTISSSGSPFSLCLHSFPASGSFPLNHLIPFGGQIIGASTLASVLPINIQGWFSLGLAGLVSFQSKGLSSVFSNTTLWKHQFVSAQPSLWSNCHIHTGLLEKP